MKLLTTLAAACCALTAFAQIPNNGFENWTTVNGTYEVPDQWGTLNNTTAPFSIFTVTKGTPGSPGASFMKITSKTIANVVVPGIAVSGVLDSTTMQPKSGFAFSQRPAVFTGKWQHMVFGSSQGYVAVTLTRWDNVNNQREVVATAVDTLSGMAMAWANFSINFTYQTGNNPDTCIIVLAASGSTPSNFDYLWVDNLAFSGTVAGVAEQSAISSFGVFPDPANDLLNVELQFSSPQQTTLEVSNLGGRVVLTQEVGTLSGTTKQTLDVSALAKGAYVLRVITESGMLARKIIIE